MTPRARKANPGPRRKLRRGWRRLLIALLIAVMAFAIATARLLVWPATGLPPQVSAIVLLAGPGDRLPVALQLAREHRAAVLVVSQGHEGYGGPCPAAVPGVKLICFDPEPSNTRGEAEIIGRLAQRYHWRSVVLVTTRTQDTRARLLVGRCFSGSVYVSTAALPLSSWPYQIAYGWGALVKAVLVYRHC